jgi:hypothetical protein
MRFQKFSLSGDRSSGKNTEPLAQAPMGAATTNTKIKGIGVFLYRPGPGSFGNALAHRYYPLLYISFVIFLSIWRMFKETECKNRR